MNNKYSLYVNSPEFLTETNLCKVIKEFGSDKNSDWHNYTSLYNYIFGNLESQYINLFEIGILKGSSLRGWKHFFKNGQIYACDIDSRALIYEDRIQSFTCDQDDIKTIREMWAKEELNPIQFDIIIDDGKHDYVSNINFLIESFYKLKAGGVYIIEDLMNVNINQYYNNINLITAALKPNYIELVKIPYDKNTVDNNLLILEK